MEFGLILGGGAMLTLSFMSTAMSTAFAGVEFGAPDFPRLRDAGNVTHAAQG